MKTSSFRLSQFSPEEQSLPAKPADGISKTARATTRLILSLAIILVAIFGQIPDLHAANSSGECYVTVNVTGNTLPSGWSYQLQYYDTDSNCYNGASGTSTQTFYKQQGDWLNKSIQWRCQLKYNNANYGTAQTNICYAGSDSVSFTVSAPAPASASSITGQPASQTVQTGASLTFTVTANGTAPHGYQWRKNGGDISGQTLPATASRTPPIFKTGKPSKPRSSAKDAWSHAFTPPRICPSDISG